MFQTSTSSHEDPMSPTRLLVLSLDENRRKFESEIGRDLVRDKIMRQELGANFSTTGKSKVQRPQSKNVNNNGYISINDIKFYLNYSWNLILKRVPIHPV